MLNVNLSDPLSLCPLQEVNSLQWELSFTQVQMNKSEQSWEQKHSRSEWLHIHSWLNDFTLRCIEGFLVFFRIVSENKILTDSLHGRESEIQQLRAENHGKC